VPRVVVWGWGSCWSLIEKSLGLLSRKMLPARSLCRLYRGRDLVQEQLRRYLEGFVGIAMLYMLEWTGIRICPEDFRGMERTSIM
jgi:hypothetical protein